MEQERTGVMKGGEYDSEGKGDRRSLPTDTPILLIL